MHYAILTYGSRGDVQPFIALALGLQKKGHRVTVAAAENFKSFVESYGVDYFQLQGNMEELLHTPDAIKMLKTGNTFTLLRYLQKAGDQTRPEINEGLLKVCQQADVLITSTLNLLYVATIAEKLHKKWAMILPNPPATPTKDFPHPDFDFLNFPAYNLFTYRLLVFGYWQLYKKRINAFRVSLGLSPVKKNMLHSSNEAKVLTLYNFSRHIIEQPRDWEPHFHVTGFFPLPGVSNTDQYTAPQELLTWLQNGELPVYIGFGSIPVPDPELLSSILLELLAETKHRFILCKGWSKLPRLPNHPNLYVVDQSNHEWLLPKCKAAIHHGGAGTLAAVLKAKIPSIIVSIFGDQPMWGKIVAHRKIGSHIPFKKVTAKNLLDAIEKTQALSCRKNAFEIGEKVNAENGIERAIEHLEAYFA
ncbi:MAG: glycosyltransferase [Bacteroidota bacterium]